MGYVFLTILSNKRCWCGLYIFFFHLQIEFYPSILGCSQSQFISKFSPDFEHFLIVRFGWNLLHRFILGWNFWRLHFFSYLNIFSLSDLDETCYINSFCDGICNASMIFLNSFPPWIPSPPPTHTSQNFSFVFKPFPIVQFWWIYTDFSEFSIEVTFSNTSTNLLAMLYDYKKFWHTELYSNSIVKFQIKIKNLKFWFRQSPRSFRFFKMAQLTEYWSYSINNGTNEFVLAKWWIVWNEKYIKKNTVFHTQN